MQLPPTTTKQKEIIFQVYKFRFLNTYHFQKQFNHKDPHRIKVWLKDLTNKGYLSRIYSRKTVTESSQPAIYYLAPKARHVLKTNPKCDLSVLNRIYKEKKRTQKFIKSSLTIAELYFYFLAQKEQAEELHFFTESELTSYKYFPKDLPSAYIVVRSGTKTKRYFLDFFDEYARSSEIRYKVRMYLDYANSGEWEANANGESMPAILLICPSEKTKKHISFYTKAKFEKAFEEKIALFLTTHDVLQKGNKNIWQKVNLV